MDTELGAKDLLNHRMAYVAVSRGAHDAQLFTNDREGLDVALGREVSKLSALGMEEGQLKVGVKMELGEELGFGLGM